MLSPATPLIALDAAVLDTETTGLDARKARIIQIGVVRLGHGKLGEVRAFDRLVNPGAPIPPETTRVHGITDAMVAGAPAFAEIAEALETEIGNQLIIGHAIGYDFAMLRREYALAKRAWPGWRALDVRELARIAAPTLADHGLDRLCEWLGIENRKRHSALGDAEATARVFLGLVPLLRERGVRTLAEAEAAIRAQAEREARDPSRGFAASNDDAAGLVAPLVKIDSFPYRHTVADLMSAPAVIVEGAITVATAAAQLISQKISSVLVRLDTGVIGIATERDLLRAIAAHGAAALEQPVARFAQHPLQTVPADAFAYRAIGRIERLGLRHLAVTDAGGALVGMVTTRNLLRHRATTAIALGDEIDQAPSAAALASAWSKVPLVARTLIEEQVPARTVCSVISAEIRAMTQRAAELAEAEMMTAGGGAPPVPYAVLVLGSGGRGESQLAADQDNAIVFETSDDGAAADAYFEKLAQRMNAILDAGGVPLCKGGVMARNAPWRKSRAAWIETIDGWVRRQRPQDLLAVDIFFDAVPVHGDTALGEAIWSHAYARGSATPTFVKMLTESARVRHNPFTLFGGFRLDAKGRLDVKRAGLMPLFTSGRVLSIRHGVRARSTPDRLAGLVAAGVVSEEQRNTLVEAQDTLLAAVLSQQLADLDAGIPPTPTVAPARLSKEEKADLSRALHAVDIAIDLVSEGRL